MPSRRLTRLVPFPREFVSQNQGERLLGLQVDYLISPTVKRAVDAARVEEETRLVDERIRQLRPSVES